MGSGRITPRKPVGTRERLMRGIEAFARQANSKKPHDRSVALEGKLTPKKLAALEPLLEVPRGLLERVMESEESYIPKHEVARLVFQLQQWGCLEGNVTISALGVLPKDIRHRKIAGWLAVRLEGARFDHKGGIIELEEIARELELCGFEWQILNLSRGVIGVKYTPNVVDKLYATARGSKKVSATDLGQQTTTQNSWPDVISDLRNVHGLSLEQLAEALQKAGGTGCGRTTVGAWASGKKLPSMDNEVLLLKLQGNEIPMPAVDMAPRRRARKAAAPELSDTADKATSSNVRPLPLLKAVPGTPEPIEDWGTTIERVVELTVEDVLFEIANNLEALGSADALRGIVSTALREHDAPILDRVVGRVKERSSTALRASARLKSAVATVSHEKLG